MTAPLWFSGRFTTWDLNDKGPLTIRLGDNVVMRDGNPIAGPFETLDQAKVAYLMLRSTT